MTYWVYILQSEKTGRYYCGQTAYLPRRLQEHNDPDRSGEKWTKKFLGPWRLVWQMPCHSRIEAMRLETHIKKRGIERYLSTISPPRVPPPAGLTTWSVPLPAGESLPNSQISVR